MLQIIRVFPHINIEKERAGIQGRSILVFGCDDLQASSVEEEPCIAGTKYGKGRLLELCPEIFQAAELAGHCFEEPGR